MISTLNRNFSRAQSRRRLLTATFSVLLATAPFATAQSTLGAPASDGINTRPELPDAPGALLTSASSSSADVIDATPGQTLANPTRINSMLPKYAPHLHLIVYQGEIAAPMTVPDKIKGGLKNSVSLFSMTGWIASAGYEQLTNGAPNFGTDSGAFGQRLGIGAIHGISNGVFSTSLFAPLFHQDPRYYVMGGGHPFLKRFVYAATRPIISRTDSGHSTPNFALFAGNAAGAALTVTYYPAQNTTFSQVTRTFATSLAGSAFGFVVDEFMIDALVDLHLKKPQQP